MRAPLEQQHHGGRRRGHVFRSASESQVALVGGMRTVDVLMRRNCVGDFADGKMRRQRLLQHDAVRRWVVTKLFEFRAHLLDRRVGRKVRDHDANAGALSRSREIAHVREAGLILSDEDDGELRRKPALAQHVRARDQLRAQIGGERASVKNLGRHAVAVRLEETGS
jgi:hypothetical protein